MDVNAIIFLAPISCFDQVLMEDTSVNRLVRVPTSRILFLDFSPSSPLGPPYSLHLPNHQLVRPFVAALTLLSIESLLTI